MAAQAGLSLPWSHAPQDNYGTGPSLYLVSVAVQASLSLPWLHAPQDNYGTGWDK